MAGAVSNPSRFAESNKVGLFQLAALFWNNKNYSENAQTVWEDAFRYLEPEVEDSYFKIASNVSNCPHSSRIGNGFPESEYLKDTLASVLNKINSGAALKNDSEVESLISEMDKIVAAVADFKENCTNTKLVQELNPWLSSLNDVATGIKAILKSAQGSSTVAITTTAGIVAPLLPVLGLDSPARACLTVIAIGAGAMTVSHANDSYFWVVTNFGEMTPQDGYKTQTLGTLVIGIASIIGVFIVSLFLH